MTRTISGALTAMLATREHTRARCLWLALRDGTTLGITDHDRDLTIDMTDVSDVPVLFRADTGILPSNIALAVGLDADNFEVRGPLGSLVTKAAVLGKRFSRARARLFDVDWEQAVPDVLPLMAGNVADAKIEGSRFIFEIRSDTDRFNQPIGRLISPYCTADFGDVKCGFSVPTVAGTVSAVTDDFRFTLGALAGVYANDHFNLGTVDFLTGDLAGTEPVEIFDYVGATGAVEMFVPLAEAPAIGDTLLLRRGCSKLRKSADATILTCVSYGNILNFRGFPEVPGSDQYLKYPVPGNSGG